MRPLIQDVSKVYRDRDGQRVFAITAKHTGASPDVIRKGFPYQDRDGRLMPGDVGRQTTWWHAAGAAVTPGAADPGRV
jgi:NitT/TauT family transport system substrate-binding protein